MSRTFVDGQLRSQLDAIDGLVRNGHWRIALGRIANELARRPDEPLLLQRLEVLVQRQPTLLQPAIETLRKAIGSPPLPNTRASLERLKGTSSAAAASALSEPTPMLAGAAGPDAPKTSGAGLFERARELAEQGDLLGALEVYERIPETDSDHAAARAAIAFIRDELRPEAMVIPAAPADPAAVPLARLPAKSAPRTGQQEVPGGTVDKVHFTVTTPEAVQPGSSFTATVWAHIEEQRQEVVVRARAAAPDVAIRAPSKGPVRVSRGAVLIVRLWIKGMLVRDSEDTILWDGEIGNAMFGVLVPEDAPIGSYQGTAFIYLDGLQLARVYFSLDVARQARAAEHDTGREERHRRAFASYASEDRADVLARIQGSQKAAPDLEVFLDVITLRSGTRWINELWRVIPSSDVFYLFWSRAASRSQWVEREWRCALQTRGLDFIDPVPLVPPDKVPPPPELSDKHFNDWALAFSGHTTVPASSSPVSRLLESIARLGRPWRQ